MTQIYTVEIDGKQYDIEGDRPPTETEARAAVGAYTAHAQPTAPGPVARFLEPIGQAARGVAELPHAAYEVAMGRGGEIAKRAIIEPSLEQAREVMPALRRGDTEEAIARSAQAIPIVGPAVAQMRGALEKGNVAGTLGQATVLAAPFAPLPKFAGRLASLLKSRAAKREFAAMKPRTGFVKTAEDIAAEVAGGTPGLEGELPGIGVGTRETLARRAAARAAIAGQDVAALQNIETPVSIAPVTRALRAEAAGLETVPPARAVLEEVPTGLLDEAGAPIMGIRSSTVPGVPGTEYPALVSALREQAGRVEKLAAQYPDELIPAGELFKQRAAAGRRVGKGYRGLPGDEPAAAVQAGKAFRAQLSKTLKEQLPGVPVAQVDRAYHVWRNAAINFERARQGALTNTGYKGLLNLLTGRLIGNAVMGGATGFAAGGNVSAGVAGAFAGAVLGESVRWQTLRAATYIKLAKLLNAGEVDAAAHLFTRASAAGGGVESTARRNREAQRALQRQAEGVVAP